MKPVLIGSRAEGNLRTDSDWDFIGELLELRKLFGIFSYAFETKKVQSLPIDSSHIVEIQKSGDKPYILEGEIAYLGTSAYEIVEYANRKSNPRHDFVTATPELMLMIRESCKYRDNEHFWKNRKALMKLRETTELNDELKAIQKNRERETYTRPPVKMNVSKDSFFSNDGVNYVYDHDWIHRVMAIDVVPAYTFIQPKNSQVATSWSMFETVNQTIRLNCVIEEAIVLAIERHFVPSKRKAASYNSLEMINLFEMSLQKMCCSIVSGKFRDFVYDNADDAIRKFGSLGFHTMQGSFLKRFETELENEPVHWTIKQNGNNRNSVQSHYP